MDEMPFTTAKLTNNTLDIEPLTLIGNGYEDPSLSGHNFYGNALGRVFLVTPLIRIAQTFLQEIQEIATQLLRWNVCTARCKRRLEDCQKLMRRFPLHHETRLVQSHKAWVSWIAQTICERFCRGFDLR